MRESGRVIFVSRNGAMLVVQHDDGYALVEMLGYEGEIPIGAQVSGDWNAVAGEPIFRDGRHYEAYFQRNWPGRAAAIEVARKTGG